MQGRKSPKNRPVCQACHGCLGWTRRSCKGLVRGCWVQQHKILLPTLHPSFQWITLQGVIIQAIRIYKSLNCCCIGRLDSRYQADIVLMSASPYLRGVRDHEWLHRHTLGSFIGTTWSSPWLVHRHTLGLFIALTSAMYPTEQIVQSTKHKKKKNYNAYMYK